MGVFLGDQWKHFLARPLIGTCAWLWTNQKYVMPQRVMLMMRIDRLDPELENVFTKWSKNYFWRSRRRYSNATRFFCLLLMGYFEEIYVFYKLSLNLWYYWVSGGYVERAFFTWCFCYVYKFLAFLLECTSS